MNTLTEAVERLREIYEGRYVNRKGMVVLCQLAAQKFGFTISDWPKVFRLVIQGVEIKCGLPVNCSPLDRIAGQPSSRMWS